MKQSIAFFLLFSFVFMSKTNGQTAVKIVGATGFCPNETANITTDSIFTSYLWSTNETTRNITVSRAGSYSIAVINTAGDTLRDTVFIAAFPLPNPTIGGTPYICPNRPTALFVQQTNYRQFLWSTGDTVRLISVSNPGSYSVSVVDQNGCRNAASTTISNGAPTALPLPDTVKICQGDSAILDATAVHAIRYFWNNDDTTAMITVRTGGIYNVIVSNGQCVSYDTTMVILLPRPMLDLGKDTILCNKDTFILRGPVNNLFTYRWHDGSTQSTFKAFDEGVYSLSVNFGNCRVSDTVSVRVFNKKQGLVLDSAICTTPYRIVPNVVVATQYKWTDGSIQPYLDVTKTSIYQVLAYNGRCYADLSYKLTFMKKPNVNFVRDTIVCLDFGTKHLDLNASWVGAKYTWSTSDTTPSVTATKSGLYYVTIVNACGTGWTNSFVTFKSCYTSFIPNAFSPNGDGENETFRIFPASDVTKIHTFQVFDRWGQLVYVANDFLPVDAEKNAWDGRVKGRAVPPAVFVYYIEIETEKGETFIQRGDVTLLR